MRFILKVVLFIIYKVEEWFFIIYFDDSVVEERKWVFEFIRIKLELE